MDLSRFNDKQKEAIVFKGGVCCLLAGPGSGKTAVITNRLVHLMESGIAPERIMACTFTKDAANEIKERTIKLYGLDADDLEMGTLHSACYAIAAKIKKKDNPKAKMTIANNGAVWMFMRSLITKHELYVRDVKEALGFISNCKLNCFSVNDVLTAIRDRVDSDLLDEKNDRQVCLYYMYRAYQQYLREKDWIDYSDMLFITYKYLSDERNADFRSMVVNKIDYLLVDEAQDMNKISYELYKIFGSKHNNIMMVGDVRQSIYGFIGSSGDYMLKFIDNYKANVINLPLNYRSTKNIIEASNNLIKVNNIPMIEDCYTVNDVGPNIQILRNDDEINEAIHIVDSIKGYIEAGIEPKDIAVVYRINAQAFPIVDMLTLENIPFILHNNDSFFTRREIRQVMTYLTAFIAPEALEFDDFALISNAPVRYIKKTTLDYIDNNNSDDYYEELKKSPSYLSGKEAGPILNLINDIEKGIRKAANGASTSELLEYIFDDLGLLDYLKTPDSANSDMESGGADNDRLLNVEVLSSLSCKYTVPKDFVHYAQQMKEKSKEKKKNKNGVNLMSVHGSKGLEFEVVFVAGCCSRLYPFYRAANDDKLIEEERRLMYVAITRPKRFLNLSTINGRFGRYKVKPSFFIDEMRIPNGKVNIADRCEKHFVPPQLHI